MASHRSRRIATAFLALASLALAGLASAAQFSLSLTRIHLNASHSVETVAFTNQEDKPVAFEVQVKRWRQSSDGTWQLVPDDSLVVHPLILRVEPGATQRLRIGSLSPTVSEEQAFRIELNELPDRTQQQQQAQGIRMLARVSVPVFVQPADATPALAVAVDAFDAQDARLLLRNTGGRYVAPAEGTLRVLDAAGKVVQEAKVTTPYVLAGAQAPLMAKLTGSACSHAASIQLLLPDAAPVAAQVAPGVRRCAP